MGATLYNASLVRSVVESSCNFVSSISDFAVGFVGFRGHLAVLVIILP